MTAFIEAIRAEADPERQDRLLAFVRELRSEALADLAWELAVAELPRAGLFSRFLGRKGTREDLPGLVGRRWHALEILLRNGRALPDVRRVPEAGRIRIDRKTGMCVVLVPAGSFRMGSEEGEEDEKPLREVTLTGSYWMGKHAVTNGEYGRYLEENPDVEEPKFWKDPRFNGRRQPVVGVSWEEARGYCEWTGSRLPTEAEWEYACRAGSDDAWCFGDDGGKLERYAWYADNSGEGDGKRSTHEVGLKRPNGNGLRDMHGNGWEWCEDRYGSYDPEQTVDPVGAGDGANRVFRGGSWSNDATGCRSADRSGYRPGDRDDDLGFRVVFPEAGRAPGEG